MKRFYCTTCEKFKRVRKYPGNVTNTTAEDPRAREGQCNWHYDKGRGMTHAESIGSKRVRPVFTGRKNPAPPPPPPKARKRAS
jgi:hypothetical protein